MPKTRSTPSTQATLSRMLIADPSAPGLAAGGGRPAIAPGYREATAREIWLWQQRTAIMLSGRLPTAEDAAELGAWYDQHVQKPGEEPASSPKNDHEQMKGTDHADH